MTDITEGQDGRLFLGTMGNYVTSTAHISPTYASSATDLLTVDAR